MTNSIYTTKIIAGAVLLTIATFALIGLTTASAATFAYVDATGEVRSVVANDWSTAISTAPNIHVNSGVFTLRTAADYAVVGEDIQVTK